VINPANITKFDQTYDELEESILFWICASGKNGVTSARCLDSLLKKYYAKTPFNTILYIDYYHDLPTVMKNHGIGCYNNKAKSFRELVSSGIDLKTCTVDDLEKIRGIGPKTSRCFLIHSRPNQQYAGLDTHLLKYLKAQGYNVPKSTPNGKKYKELEQIFLSLVRNSGKTVAEFDLEVWRKYSGNKVA
jgi:thermostable 8-oxoguanine DNA glycosylase